ncbi:MAG: MFS transporter [Burkholderiaceae bacterium]|nr:MFS transporter [Burkholderiaceae bacterium]
MQAIHPTYTTPPVVVGDVPRRLVLMLATGAGLAVASIYYAQPMLGVMGADLQAGPRATGWVPTLTQLGYALGILLLAPLGDRFDRRRLICAKAAALVAALLGCAVAPGIGGLLLASLAIGLAGTLAQDIVPAAATLAPPAQRGRVVGTVMTGLLLGILLSRVASGWIADQLGWRATYFIAAASIALTGCVAWRALPPLAPTTQLGYGALIGSLVQLWRRHAGLRRATLSQGLLSVGFSAFWSTLAVMLHQQFGLGSAAAGAFGLAGAAGALAAPLAGRLADRRGPELAIRLGAALAAVGFAALALDALLATPALRLALIVACAIAFDFGVQAAMVAHQTQVYGLEPEARSRLNAVLFTGMFTGMAAGALLGSLALAQWGWGGVAALATLTTLGGLAVRLVRARA